jgi:hypothetical protein
MNLAKEQLAKVIIVGVVALSLIAAAGVYVTNVVTEMNNELNEIVAEGNN